MCKKFVFVGRENATTVYALVFIPCVHVVFFKLRQLKLVIQYEIQKDQQRTVRVKSKKVVEGIEAAFTGGCKRQ